MAESTLSLKLADLLSQVALFLGYERDPVKQDATTAALLQSFVNSGLSQFYNPPPVPPSTSMHEWSFLKPVATLFVPNAVQSVMLPDDFGGLEGRITVLTPPTNVGGTQSTWPIEQVAIGTIHERYAQYPQASGRPIMAALSPLRGTGPSRGSREELWVFPRTDTNYTFQFQYYLLPDALTVANPYYYGGAAHADTVLESCLLIAESRLDDVPLQACVHYGTFMSRLSSSIDIDSRHKPKLLGYNRDRSDHGMGMGRWGRHSNWPVISVNGIDYQ